jgi:hypothetical protein
MYRPMSVSTFVHNNLAGKDPCLSLVVGDPYAVMKLPEKKTRPFYIFSVLFLALSSLIYPFIFSTRTSQSDM